MRSGEGVLRGLDLGTRDAEEMEVLLLMETDDLSLVVSVDVLLGVAVVPLSSDSGAYAGRGTPPDPSGTPSSGPHASRSSPGYGRYVYGGGNVGRRDGSLQNNGFGKRRRRMRRTRAEVDDENALSGSTATPRRWSHLS